MMVMTEAPAEIYDEFVVPPMCTRDGEVLSRVSDTPAGAWLAVLLDGVDVSTLTAWDMPAYLQACSRVQAWAGALLAAGVAHYDAISPGPVDAEVALALAEPIGAAQTRIYRARRLLSWLPATWARLRTGELSTRHVDAVLDATSTVEDTALLADVEESVLARAAGKTPAELARAVRDALKRLDPTGAQRRAKAARDQADVTLLPGADGMADVIVHAPVEDAAIVKTAADAYAVSCKQAGDPRPIGRLRAEAPVRWASSYLVGLADGHVPRAAGRPLEVGIVVGLRTALGLEDLPGELPGLGIIPRDVIAALVRAELPKLRLLVIDETTGRLVHRAEASYRPTGEQVAHIRATYVFSVGPGSTIRAERTDTDHVTPHPAGPTSIDNLIPLDRTWHNRKTRGHVTITTDHDGRVTTTSAHGQSRTVTPYDYRTTEPLSATRQHRSSRSVDDVSCSCAADAGRS